MAAGKGEGRRAWIEVVPEDQWTGDLEPLLEACLDPGQESVDNILAVHSLDPAGLAAHLAVYRSAMAGTAGLRKVDRELVALVVSQTNDCHY